MRAKTRRAYLRKHPNARKNMSLGATASTTTQTAVLRKIILDGYGRKCACCGESNEKFLQVDHVNNDGNVERRGSKKNKIFRRIIKDGFPPRYQILCANCNWGKEQNGGICPHIEIVENPKAHREVATVAPQRTELPLAALWNGSQA